MKIRTIVPAILLACLVTGCKTGTSKVQTEFGELTVDRDGEYLIDNWDLFMKVFTKAVSLEDRELLKDLSGSDVSYDEPLPDGSMQIWRDTAGKSAVDRIDFRLVREMLQKNLYRGFYKRGLFRSETRYFAGRENPEHEWMMSFRKAPGGAWKFYLLWYIGEHQNY